jgi:lipopolysaccharide transport system permease protein
MTALSSQASDRPTLVINAKSADANYWRDLWRYREILYFLAWKDIIVRYKQTVAGTAWALMRPLLTTIVFTVLFGKLGKFPANGAPYPIIVLAAMLPWQLFASAISASTHSLVNNTNLISKVYFPRLLVPASTLGVALVDFLITLGILGVMMVIYGVSPTWRLLTLPLFTLLALAAVIGPGMLIGALMVNYRDFKHVVPFLVQLGAYVCPVGFSSGIVPEKWRLLYSCNPLVGVIDGFRWAIYGEPGGLYLPGFILSVTLVILFIILGVWYFRRTEDTFADVI